MNPTFRLLSTTLAMVAFTAGPARADDRLRVPLPAAYVQECGSCHVPYAPTLLPASSWQRLMGGLGRHFGTDASVDAGVQRELTAWLTTHAATGRRAEPPPDDRITRSAWFGREHREVAARFGTPAVRRASDCAACHTQAPQGSYREREIRLPR